MVDNINAPEHIPPSSVEAEEAVLGSILINADALYEVATFISPSDFFIARHMWIWEAITALFDRHDAIDNITLIQELRQRGQLDDCGGPAYITYLINNTPTHIHAVTYGRIVERAAIRRRLLNAAGDIAQMALEENAEVSQIVDRAEATLFAATEGKNSRRMVHIREAASDYYDKIAYLAKHPDELPGLPSGFYDLDRLTRGFKPGNLILIAARPGIGKSALLKSIAINAARQKKRIAIFSMEMTIEEVMERIYSEDTGIDGNKLASAQLDDREWELFTESMARLGHLDIWLDDPSNLTIRQLAAKCRRLYREFGLDLIIVDYIQLMGSAKDERNRTEEISQISRGLKVLAQELKVPILCAAQLNRKVEDRADKRPMLSDLRESGSLEQDANVVMFLYRESEYNPAAEDPNATEVIVAKHRGGPTGTVVLGYDKPRTRYINRRKAA